MTRDRQVAVHHAAEAEVAEFHRTGGAPKHGVDLFPGEHIHFGTEAFPNCEAVVEYLECRATPEQHAADGTARRG